MLFVMYILKLKVVDFISNVCMLVFSEIVIFFFINERFIGSRVLSLIPEEMFFTHHQVVMAAKTTVRLNS